MDSQPEETRGGRNWPKKRSVKRGPMNLYLKRMSEKINFVFQEKQPPIAPYDTGKQPNAHARLTKGKRKNTRRRSESKRKAEFEKKTDDSLLSPGGMKGPEVELWGDQL